MMGFFLRLLGRRAVHKAVGSRLPGSPLDVRFGLSLFRDRRVPTGRKLLAVGLGAGLMALLIAWELPLEGLWALLLPMVALPLEVVVDGMEAVVGPILLAGLLLPHLAPRTLITQIREEHHTAVSHVANVHVL